MNVDFIIVGQGICGTMLSWYLHKEGKTFFIIDDGKSNASSRIAAGIINPVTGRRYVYTWMIDELLPFIQSAYSELENYFDTKLIYQKGVIDFFPSPQMRNAFVDRVLEDDTYLHAYPDQNRFNQYFNYDFGCGEISPCFIIDVEQLLALWRDKLLEQNGILNETFNYDHLQLKADHVIYNSHTAGKIIFCDGIQSLNNSWFSLLPFSANKGEVLIIESGELTNEHIFKRSLFLAPLTKAGLFWVGSNYLWDFEDEQPSEQFYNTTKSLLDKWLKVPYHIIAHKASIRPATVERRPFVGLHPHQPLVGILNGMGTKGTSLAPYFAYQLVQHLVHNLPITDEANVSRFSRILSK